MLMPAVRVPAGEPAAQHEEGRHPDAQGASPRAWAAARARGPAARCPASGDVLCVAVEAHPHKGLPPLYSAVEGAAPLLLAPAARAPPAAPHFSTYRVAIMNVTTPCAGPAASPAVLAAPPPRLQDTAFRSPR
ncbi:jg15749 [Pararge aegeria aegeria]|uniref:Jg15749 protein n=1 Tax=Pararge aegeria aegeria TaxID=348720 RepID=A0A8S4RKV0_9NEOP|nr:jg15749 [Pararge aegeria aegeria]